MSERSRVPYSIGGRPLPGLSKVLEEAGEVIQVGGKFIATGGAAQHWDGTDLHERMRDELADLSAAITFYLEANGIHSDERDAALFRERVLTKLMQFRSWHAMPTLPPSAEKAGAV